MRLLFVCTGNICRSPLAEGYARMRLAVEGLGWEVDSAGTGAWHVGEEPDPRAKRVAADRGYEIGDLRGRQVVVGDFYAFDHIVALDQGHLSQLRRLKPRDSRIEPTLLLGWADGPDLDVQDPYYDNEMAFEGAADVIEAGVDSLIEALRA